MYVRAQSQDLGWVTPFLTRAPHPGPNPNPKPKPNPNPNPNLKPNPNPNPDDRLLSTRMLWWFLRHKAEHSYIRVSDKVLDCSQMLPRGALPCAGGAGVGRRC